MWGLYLHTDYLCRHCCSLFLYILFPPPIPPSLFLLSTFPSFGIFFFFYGAGHWTNSGPHASQSKPSLGAATPPHTLLFSGYLETVSGSIDLTRLVLMSACTTVWTWSCSPPASASRVAEIIVICHKALLASAMVFFKHTDIALSILLTVSGISFWNLAIGSHDLAYLILTRKGKQCSLDRVVHCCYLLVFGAYIFIVEIVTYIVAGHINLSNLPP